MYLDYNLKNKKTNKSRNILFIFIVLFLCGLYINNILFKVPENFKVNSSFEVVSGDSVYSVSEKLKQEGYIRSASVFRLISIFKNREGKIVQGVYDFKNEMNILQVVNKFINNRSDRASLVLTVPEGFTNLEIANRLASITNNKIDRDNFLFLAKDYEGKLFPDTYYLSSSDTEQIIIQKMLAEFDEKVGAVSKEDIVMASILEGEARYREDMQIVSGILKERLRIGMALQVDVATSTYKERGLPDKPINNPGLNAFYAVQNPINTDYLYYITGDDGNMYYAKTFEQHKKNIVKYLK